MSQNNCYNLKPEALLAALIQSGFSADDMDMELLGDFKKKYRGSVDSLEIEERSVYIELNEKGIYNQLPEGLFHQSRGNSHNQSYKNYIDEHNRYKQEANQARKFFNPLDETLLFAKADALLRKDSTVQALLKDATPFLLRLWHLEAFKENAYLKDFLPLLHQVDYLKGRPDRIAGVLQRLLQCKVTVSVTIDPVSTGIELDECLNQQALLGINTSLQAQGCEDMLHWYFVIESNDWSQIERYAGSHDVAELLELMTYFFVPLDVIERYEFLNPEPNVLEQTFVGVSTL